MDFNGYDAAGKPKPLRALKDCIYTLDNLEKKGKIHSFIFNQHRMFLRDDLLEDARRAALTKKARKKPEKRVAEPPASG